MSKVTIKNKTITGIVILILLAFLGIKFFASHNIEQETIIPVSENQKASVPNTPIAKTLTGKISESKAETQTEPTRDFQSVKILAGDTAVNLQVAPNTIFYDALVQAKNAGKIEFSGKNYPGLGFFVTDIGTLHAGNGKDLLYYINGKEASVGVSSYTLKDGDVIEWKLE